LIVKERAWNKVNNYGAGFLLLTKLSQEEHSWSTRRLRLFREKQKDKPECSSYFMHASKYIFVISALVISVSAVAADGPGSNFLKRPGAELPALPEFIHNRIRKAFSCLSYHKN
jgi:hypothetical protein